MGIRSKIQLLSQKLTYQNAKPYTGQENFVNMILFPSVALEVGLKS